MVGFWQVNFLVFFSSFIVRQEQKVIHKCWMLHAGFRASGWIKQVWRARGGTAGPKKVSDCGFGSHQATGVHELLESARERESARGGEWSILFYPTVGLKKSAHCNTVVSINLMLSCAWVEGTCTFSLVNLTKQCFSKLKWIAFDCTPPRLLWRIPLKSCAKYQVPDLSNYCKLMLFLYRHDLFCTAFLWKPG